MIQTGNMGASDWNYNLGKDDEGKSIAWIMYSCGVCRVAPLLAAAWYRLVKCWDKMVVADEYCNKQAMWHCANCITEHKNMHELRLLVLKKPDGTFMMDYVGTFNKNASPEEKKINNGYQNKLKYLQLVSLCDKIVNKFGETIELEEVDMLVVIEEVQRECAHDLRAVQGLRTFQAVDPQRPQHPNHA